MAVWTLTPIADPADGRAWFTVNGEDVPAYLSEVAILGSRFLDREGRPVEDPADLMNLFSASCVRNDPR